MNKKEFWKLTTILFLFVEAGCCNSPNPQNNTQGVHQEKLASTEIASPQKEGYKEICMSIARDISSLQQDFPQLADFSITHNVYPERCIIDYEYKCHRPKHIGGWRGGILEPDPDGLWFYIGLWDENDPIENQAPINTKYVMPLWHLGQRRVTFLILEGEKTKQFYGEILKILKRHGVQ